MLLILQLPLADLRPFLVAGRVVGPMWSLPPDPQRRGFLRGIGPLRTVRDTGAVPLAEWPTDAWYVDAQRALRLPGIGSDRFARSSAAFGTPVAPIGSMRRIACDGSALWHVQLGLRFAPSSPPTMAALQALLADFGDLPVQVGTATIAGAKPLLAQRNALADWLVKVTTPRSVQQPPAGRRPMLAGTPMIYLEASAGVAPGIAGWMPTPGQPLGVDGAIWCGRWPPGRDDCTFVCVETARHADRAQVNNLRLNVFRLHAEREVTKLVLRSASRLTSTGAALERYLQRAHRLLTQPNRFGQNQQALKAAFGVYDSFTAAERAAVSDLLAQRTQSLARVGTLIDELEQAGRPVAVNIFQAGARMSTVNVTGSNTIGQINVETLFNESTNIVQQSAAGPMKEALEKLLDQTRQLAARLPEDQREDVVKNTETIAREASSKKPNSAILGISAKGLIEAANTVADLAKPIATAVGAVLGILGLAL